VLRSGAHAPKRDILGSREYGGEALSAYDVELADDTGKPTRDGGARLFEITHQRSRPQPRLFALDEAGC
jgi:hypothetical protein